MTERVDIQVTDKIDGTIPKKLRDIAANAREGYAQVNNLAKAVKSLQSQQMNQLAAAANALETNMLKQMRAQKQLDVATSQAAITDTRAAVEKQRLAIATAQAEIAQERLALTQLRGEVATAKLAAQENRLAAAERAKQGALQGATAAQNAANAATNQAVGLSRQQQFASQNILFQLNDVVVGLASGQKPLTVFLQQGSQIATAFGPGANVLKELGRVLVGMAVKFAPIIAGLTLAAGAVSVLQDQIQTTSGVAVSFGDTVVGVFNTFAQRITGAAEAAFAPLKPLFDSVFGFFVDSAVNAVRGAAILWNFLPGVIGNAINTMANGFNIAWNYIVQITESAVNLAIKGLNVLIGALNFFPGLIGQKVADPIKELSFDAAKRGLLEVKDLTNLWGDSVAKADTGLKGLYDQIVANSLAAKKAREEDEKGFNKVEELKKVNDALDAQTRSMYKLADARRVQEQLDQIALNFAENKKPLDAQELATIRQKLQTIQSYARVQKETDRILEEVTGAQKTWTATLQGATRLLREGIITQAEYEREVLKSARALQDAQNPFAEYERTVENATALTGFFGDELQRQQTVQAQVQAALSKGVVATQDWINKQLAAQKVLQDSAKFQAALSQAYDDANGPLDAYNLALGANFVLMYEGQISQDAYTQAVARAELAYKQATDPLYEYNRSTAEAQMLAMAYGDEQAVLNAQLQLYNTLLPTLAAGMTFAQFAQSALGMSVRDTTLALEQQLRAQSAVQAVLNDITAQTFYTDNMALMYQEIDRLRQADLISHQTAEKAKLNIAYKATEERLTQAKDFFSSFAGLQSSGNKKIAAIGKAAAISQAIIDGILASQKALSAFPPPFNFIAAAGVAATAAVNVANIKAQNVGAFKDGGQFTVGGRAGVDTNLVQMSVTKGERVTVETAAQQRGRGNNAAAPAPQVNVPVKVVNVIDPQEALSALDTPEGEAVVLNILRRNPDVVKQTAAG